MGESGHKHKQTKAIINHLSRIEGHVRSIKTMVEGGFPKFLTLSSSPMPDGYGAVVSVLRWGHESREKGA